MESINILIDIRKIVRSINLESKRIQKDFGISIPQLLCLGHLFENASKTVTHKELMSLLSLNSSTITGIINRLEKKGYVKRKPQKDDKRITLISLTAKGRRVAEKSPTVLHDKLSQKIQKLPHETQHMIKKSLQIIVQAMNIEELDASPLLTISDPIEENVLKGQN